MNLDKWFDPAFATGVSCRDLPFAKAKDSAGVVIWKYEDSLFFPIDSMAPPGQLEGVGDFAGVQELTYPPGYSGRHNFNWCMEINAQFKYRGGEALDFKGDDDVWVFLDNKLVVDLGGIHGAMSQPKLMLDTLPFIAGKQGEAFDFDLYFCERRPAGSSFAMQTGMDLKPVIFQDLEIGRSDGQILNPKQPVVGKTRLCALPDFGQSFCGNQAPPPPGTFYPATWTVNGAVVARDSACIDLDPADLPVNKRVTLSAKAESKTAKLNLQVLKANIPYSLVLKGNGRLESLEMAMDAKSDSLEAPIRIDYPFAGAQRSDSAGPASFDRARHVLSLALAAAAEGPCGYSGLDSGTGLVSQTVIGFPLSFTVALKDSISPALRHAAWEPSAQRSDLQLDFVPSEAMDPQLRQAVGLVFKNKQGATFHLDLHDAVPIQPGADSFRVAFPENAPFQPKDVDSISLHESMKDVAGNAARPLFIAMPPIAWGPGHAEIEEVSLNADPIKGADFDPIAVTDPLLVVNGDGSPLDPGGDNAKVASAQGPLLNIRSSGRLDRLEVWVYTNLGTFVSHGIHAFSDAEWNAIRKQSLGDTATLHVMWYPAAAGAKLGTGAYILKGSITTRYALAQGKDGLWREQTPTFKIFGPMRFGYLRH